ncbi:ImpA family protein [Escherichia coli 96.154]|nr:ImpA family protein [Escherichia coli 96.154]
MGFPSPATDYAEQELDLNSYCISRPAATFFLHASSESMNQAGLQSQSTPDRSLKPYGFFTLYPRPYWARGYDVFC